MKPILVALSLAGLVVGPAYACPLGQVQYVQKQVKVYQPAQYKVVKLQQIYQGDYSYLVGYDVRANAQAELVARKIEEKLDAKLAAFEQRIQALQGEASPPPPPSEIDQNHPGLVYMGGAGKCINCHAVGTKPVVEDGAPMFFDERGALTATADEFARMLDSVYQGRMPKKPHPEATDDEYLALKNLGEKLFPPQQTASPRSGRGIPR